MIQGGLQSDDELYNVGKVRYVNGNLSESSDDDAGAKAKWVWEGDKETGDWVFSESGHEHA